MKPLRSWVIATVLAIYLATPVCQVMGQTESIRQPANHLAPRSEFSQPDRVQDRIADFLNHLPIKMKFIVSYLAVGVLAYVSYSVGIPSAKEHPALSVVANIGLYTMFQVFTDFLGQWISQRGILKSQVLWAIPSGLVQAIVTWICYSLINWVAPANGKWPLFGILAWMGLLKPGTAFDMTRLGPWFFVANVRTLATFVAVVIRGVIYSKIVKAIRGKAAKTGQDSEQARLSQEKNLEAFWMARGPSYFKNFFIQMYLPADISVAAEGVATQFFQIFYTWSTNKQGFMVEAPARRTWYYLIAYPFLGLFWKVQDRFWLLVARTQPQAKGPYIDARTVLASA